jgi:hypothetical protein
VSHPEKPAERFYCEVCRITIALGSPLSAVPPLSPLERAAEPNIGSAPATFASLRMILSEKNATFRHHAINLT